MTFIPPTSARNVGSSVGGGLLDSITGGSSAAAGATGQTTQGTSSSGGFFSNLFGSKPAADGSVGLFDGVLKKALLGASAGVGIGFLPFIPGGPILGGLVGSVVGAGIGIFQNFKKIKDIQAQNQAYLAAAGVQPQTQEEQQMLLSGNVQGLYAGQTGTATQGAVQQGTATQGTAKAPTQDELVAVVQAARKGDQQAQQAIGLVVQAAQQGDAQAGQVVQQLTTINDALAQQDALGGSAQTGATQAQQAATPIGGTQTAATTQATTGAAQQSSQVWTQTPFPVDMSLQNVVPQDQVDPNAAQQAASVTPKQADLSTGGGDATQASQVGAPPTADLGGGATQQQVLQAELLELEQQIEELKAAIAKLQAQQAAA